MSDTWRDKAACKGIAHNPDYNPDEDPFYDPPDRDDGGDKWEYARALCASCPVQMDCLTDALRSEGKGGVERHGFRGGLTPNGRKRVSLGLPGVPKPRKPKDTSKPTKAEVEATVAVAKARTPLVHRRRNEWVDNIIDLLDLGITGPEILHRLSRRADGVYKRLERAGRLDVWERLDIPQNFSRRAS